MNVVRYAVLGAGHGGKAMAAHLALLGHQVTLWNRTPARVAAIREIGGIELESNMDEVAGLAHLHCVTSDMAEALDQADVVMVVVPSSAHREIATIASAHVNPRHKIVLNPGRTGGALEFAQVLRENGRRDGPVVAEAGTFIYASRSTGPAEVRIFGMKQAVPLAALPAKRTAEVLEVLHPTYPQFVDGGNVLRTGLDNMGMIFHPALAILNAGRIEDTKGDFQFYIDGVTPSVARVLEVLDRERVTVAAALGIKAMSVIEWLRMAYDAHGDNLYEAVHDNESYYGITAPGTLMHRYIFEDVPMSLVPIAALGRRYGVTTSGIEAFIRIASILHQTDFWRRGRSLEKLGIATLSVSELTFYVENGFIP